jgi:hypothetical protein
MPVVHRLGLLLCRGEFAEVLRGAGWVPRLCRREAAQAGLGCEYFCR